MKVLIAGGSGFVGRALSKSVAAGGASVTVLGRGATPTGNTAGIRFVRWDPTATGEYAREFDGAHVVYNLAGAGVMDRRWTSERIRELKESRVAATTRVASLCVDHRVPVLVNASAIGFYGTQTGDEEVDEKYAAGRDTLADICSAWEQALAPARESSVRVVAARLGIVLGRGGGALAAMLPSFRAFIGGPIGSGKQWMSWIHLADAVSALEFVASHACSGPFNLVAPHAVRMNTFATELGRALKRPAVLRVPGFAMKTILGSDRAEMLLTGQRVVPRALTNAGFSFRFPTLDGALADLLL